MKQLLTLENLTVQYTRETNIYHMVATFAKEITNDWAYDKKLYRKFWFHTQKGYDLTRKLLLEKFAHKLPKWEVFKTEVDTTDPVELEIYVSKLISDITPFIGRDFLATVEKNEYTDQNGQRAVAFSVKDFKENK